jgi:phosphoglycolate phosphatase-like HAD superfamily hydrolase
MILDMMKKFRLNNSELLKVGDTITDIREGKNAGVLTAAILSGTQSQEELVSQEPDYVINSLSQLKDIIN